MAKHDVEKLKANLKQAFNNEKEITGDELIARLEDIQKVSEAETKKMIAYARRKGLVSARHICSHTFYYSIQFLDQQDEVNTNDTAK